MPISAAGCLGSITTHVSPQGKRSSSFLSRVAGLIRSRGSLSKDPRAIKINDPLANIAIAWRYQSWIPIYPFFLPFYPAALIAPPTIFQLCFSSFRLTPAVTFILHICHLEVQMENKRLWIISINYICFFNIAKMEY